MSNPENLSLNEFNHIGDYPLQVQFSALITILNAQVQAKLTDETYKPKMIKDRIPGHTIPTDYHLNLKKVD